MSWKTSLQFLEKHSTSLSFFISALLALGGWYYSGIQDRNQVLLQIRISYLSDAYRDISYFSTLLRRNQQTYEDFIRFERSLKNLQLYGEQDEVAEARRLITAFGRKGSLLDFDPLLNLVRRNLRVHLGMEPIEGNTFWVEYLGEHATQPSAESQE